MSKPDTTRFVFPLYPGVTHLDFCGPHQVFARLPGADIVVASESAQDITADGLTFAGLADLGTVDRCDVLCVPGGFGCTDAMVRPGFMDAIKRLAGQSRYVTSVCTGSLILAAAGLLDGRRAACHWAWRDMLSAFGAVPDDRRVVNDGPFWTGGGVTAGIDFALSLVAEMTGDDEARKIQLGLEYAPAPPFNAGRPDTAPAHVVQAYKTGIATRLDERRQALEKAAAAMRF